MPSPSRRPSGASSSGWGGAGALSRSLRLRFSRVVAGIYRFRSGPPARSSAPEPFASVSPQQEQPQPRQRFGDGDGAVEGRAVMELRGKSLPATAELPASWHRVEGSQQLEDHGIKVEHVYQLHNKGPSTVSGVNLRLAVPNQLGGRTLLYPLEVDTEGGMNCTNPPGLNAKQLEIPRPTGAAPQNGTHQQERREVEEPPGAGLEKPITVDCSNTACVGITCRVPSLAEGQRALVSVRAQLRMDTLQQREHPVKQFLIESRAWFNTSAMPYRIRPRVLPAGEATAVTEVVCASFRGEGAVPVWCVVLGVLAGLLILTLLILMRKTGFFKRTRPPTEATTELVPGQAQEPGGAQG